MKVNVVYGKRFKDRINIDAETVEFNTKSKPMLIDLFIHLVNNYDRTGKVLFGTNDIKINVNVQVKINGKPVSMLNHKLKNKDRIELI